MRRIIPLYLGFWLVACDDGAPPAEPARDAAAPVPRGDAEADTGVLPDAGPPPGPRATLAFEFGTYPLDPFEETTRCVSWRLDNDAPLYVETVRFESDGAFHHSNWFVVPEDEFPGPDGFWSCRERGFDEFRAARAGTVLFAQSTQSRVESQRLGPGLVVKVPPRHMVVSDVHLLNLSSAPGSTRLRMALEVIHPRDVKTVVTPFRMSYLDLDIPPRADAHFTGECDLATPYERATGGPFDLKLYWVLPHYHELGNFFELAIVGGPRDGEVVYALGAFDAEANGRAFAPPLSLEGARGLRFTCGYRNPRPRPVGWGIGDQEMCVMLGFADGKVLLDATVPISAREPRVEDGIVHREGPCRLLTLPRNETQAMPGEAELAGDLVVPERFLDDGRPSDLTTCRDTPADAAPVVEPSLDAVHDAVFRPGCTFSACHGGVRPAAGLDLTRENLRAKLLGHTVTGPTELPLVAPGDPEGSWLYQRISRCEPPGGVSHMPLNAPTLMEPGAVAVVRAWIAAGAPE